MRTPPQPHTCPPQYRPPQLAMSTKATPHRVRKPRHKDEMKQEIVAQVHTTLKKEKEPLEATDNVHRIEISDSSSETNRTFTVNEDKNENYSMHTPSREISVDGDTQINSKIITLIETEMKRDINKHSHFTDSRPQSLSFYEDEKMPEELSGNLELLSPEERKHYKKRKEYLQMDTDERNTYNAIQDLYTQDDEIVNPKKSKSRKKRHTGGGDTELGMGDSREMMIPKEKRKSKKKKRENSPLLNGKRKHRKREEEHELKNEIAVALEDLHDDVFDNHEDVPRPEKSKRSPRKSDKLYVQKKNKFEVTTSRPIQMGDGSSTDVDTMNRHRAADYYPIEMATMVQGYWRPFATLCQGLLGGMSMAHLLFLRINYRALDEYLIFYSNFCDVYVCLFYFLCVICLISVFDRYDVAHLDCIHIKELTRSRKSAITIFMYIGCMLVHLAAARIDDKIALVSYNIETVHNITNREIEEWSNMSLWRAILAFGAWIISSLATGTDMLYLHLKNMEKYIITNR